ncbi:hypothetical protein KP509_05G027200 [Ceratopteris richardii]|nr:hypothetical protein KP509_05G027200 [Ceratopteris richardii]
MLGYSDAPQASDGSSATGGGSSGSLLHDLACACVQSLVQGEWQRSIQLINALSERASAHGDASERVASYFRDGLVAWIAAALGESRVSAQLSDTALSALYNVMLPISAEESQAAFLSFNQVSPFLRFSHLTANQAILEAIEGWEAVHIVDVDIMQGVQWPPFLQALAERDGGPPRVRISGVGLNASLLEQTGQRLTTFADSLGLPMFEFHSILCDSSQDLTAQIVERRPREALAMNCMPQLRHMMTRSGSQGWLLSLLRCTQPTIITLAEQTADYSQVPTERRFRDAYRHYAALFESLEATLPPLNQERRLVEEVWLKGEIVNVVSAREGNIIENQYPRWRELIRENGFHVVQHSAFALSQARMLLRLRYPAEGYTLQEGDDSLLLGWQGVPLFAVSAWSSSR